MNSNELIDNLIHQYKSFKKINSFMQKNDANYIVFACKVAVLIEAYLKDKGASAK